MLTPQLKSSSLQYESQLSFIVALQRRVGTRQDAALPRALRLVSLVGAGEPMVAAMIIVCFMGYEDMYLALARQLCLSLAIMGSAKTLFGTPRPFFVSKEVKQLDPTSERSYGFPSGHTVCTISMYGLVALRFGGHTALVALMCLTPVIMLSRLYTGAHFIHDVVGGAALGCIVLWLSSGTHMLYNSMGPWDVPLPSHDAAAPSAGWLLRGPLGLTAAIVWLVFMVLLARSPQRGRIQAARVREALEGLGLICGLALTTYLCSQSVLGCDCDATQALPVAPRHRVAAAVLGAVCIAAILGGAAKVGLLHSDADGYRSYLHVLGNVAAGAAFLCCLAWAVPCAFARTLAPMLL